MNMWFTVKVKYTKQLENGMFKRITEPYLLAAMTFTDAETRIYEELDSIIRGEFDVVSIARTEVHDIFMYDDTEVWWKCKITYEASELHSEKTKKISQTFLVSAENAKEAYERICESLSTLLVDFSVLSIIYSPIVEIFPYREDLDRELERRPMEQTDVEDTKTQITQQEEQDAINEDEDIDPLNDPSDEDLKIIEESLDEFQEITDDEYDY